MDRNNAIGKDGTLPWHISGDLKYFKRTTAQYPVIMGRKTYESLPFRPLKGRLNIVLSRGGADIPGALCVGSLDEAYAAAGDASKCFVIGGASVYEAAMDSVDTMYVTMVHTEVAGADSYFPEIDTLVWNKIRQSDTFKDGDGMPEYEFAVYARKK